MGDATNAAYINAASQAINNAGSILAQSNINKRTQKWNEKMYAQQRQDSLADWAMQNEYNSPLAQMARFRDAGLNPHLIYGQTNTADAVRSTNVQGWNPRAPQLNLNGASVMASYYDVKLKEAQIDNLRTANTVATQEAILKAAQTANTAQQTAKSTFDLDLAKSLRETSLQAAEANLRQTQAVTDKTIADTTMTLDNNERQKALTASSLQEAAQRILNSRAQELETKARTGQTLTQTEAIKLGMQNTRLSSDNLRLEAERLRESIKNLNSDNTIKQLDIQLKKGGIQPQDAIYWRVLGRLLESFKQPGKKQEFKDIWNGRPDLLR